VLTQAAGRADSGRRAFAWSAGYGSGASLRAAIHAEQRPLARRTLDEARCRALIDGFARDSTWQVPTLFLQLMAPRRLDTTAAVRAEGRYVPPATRRLWEENSVRSAISGDAFANSFAQGEWYLALVRRLRDAGVPLLAGTDISNPWMVPGFSLHHELSMLVEAGLTPVEALRTATTNPARFLGTADSLGRVVSGHVADFVLLEGDPTRDIANTARIRGVVLNGRYLDRAELDHLLRTAEQAAQRSAP
jgi:hypothetical protein